MHILLLSEKLERNFRVPNISLIRFRGISIHEMSNRVTVLAKSIEGMIFLYVSILFNSPCLKLEHKVPFLI